MIPVKITVTGNIPEGRKLVGFAKKQMAILENLMSFQGLKQGARTVKPFPGVVVECWSRFSLQEIRVHVAGGHEEEPKIVEEGQSEQQECLCLPHFAMAIITKVTPEKPAPGDVNYEAALAAYNLTLPTRLFQYDVEICSTDAYIVFEGAYDANFGRYEAGQYVLAAPGEEMLTWDSPLDCARGCLVDSPRFDNLIIVPIHVPGKMKKWLSETKHDD